MGTRGFLGFVVNGEEKIAYNHWDSYPSHLGITVLSFLREYPELLARAADLRAVSDDVPPTEEDIQRLAQYTNTSVGSGTHDWYNLLRETQGDPEKMLESGFYEDAGDFPLDSLFAEWGYLIDLDTKTFEVYRGFQTKPHTRGRFATREVTDEYNLNQGYQPVALVAQFPLSDLPGDEDFISALPKDE